MTSRTKAAWLFAAAAVLIVAPYVIVFGIGSVWMWRHGLIWVWAMGTGVPTLVGLLLLEWARRSSFPAAAACRSPPAASTPARAQAGEQAVQEISRRLQARIRRWISRRCWRRLPHDVLCGSAGNRGPALSSAGRSARVAGARRAHRGSGGVGRPRLSPGVRRKRALGQHVTPGQLLWWKTKGELAWQIGTYLWQINRVRRLVHAAGHGDGAGVARPAGARTWP